MGDRVVAGELLTGAAPMQKPHYVTCLCHTAAAISWGADGGLGAKVAASARAGPPSVRNRLPMLSYEYQPRPLLAAAIGPFGSAEGTGRRAISSY
jgi:hypothetical protein